MKIPIPKELFEVRERLLKREAQAYIVGGYVRDYLLNKPSKDIDLFCSLNLKELQKLFPESTPIGTSERHKIVYTINYKGIEISSFRKNGRRTMLGKDLREHCATCDFTVNSMAIDIFTGDFIDYFGGRYDLDNRILKFVGDVDKRIEEDPLRLLRAVRFIVTKGLTLTDSYGIVNKTAHKIRRISPERIREEFNNIILSNYPAEGVDILYRLNLLRYLFPELVVCKNHFCGKNHRYDVYRHILAALKAEKTGDLATRLALFFHDQTKPIEYDGDKFIGHEISGAKLARAKMEWLKYPKKLIVEVENLISNHMFMGRWYSKNGKQKILTDKAIRRLVNKVGPENIDKLLIVRECDKAGKSINNVPPFEEIEYVRNKLKEFAKNKNAFSRKDLAIDGNHLIKLNIPPNKRGKVLEILLNKVLDNPKLNTKKELLKIMEEIKDGY